MDVLIDRVEQYKAIAGWIPDRREKGFELLVDSAVPRGTEEFECLSAFGGVRSSDISLEIADRKTREWNKVGLGAFDATERVDTHFGMGAFDAKELRWVAEAIETKGSIVWLGGDFDCRMEEFLAGDFPGSQVELVVA